MAASAWIKYNVMPHNLGNKIIDMDGDTFKCQLHTSTYSPNVESHTIKADLSNEVANGNGYTTGGVSVTPTWTRSTTTVTWDVSDPQWTASGGSITSRYAVIYDDTPTSPVDPLMCYALLDTTPADVTVTDGNTLTIQINASGVFQITGMTS